MTGECPVIAACSGAFGWRVAGFLLGSAHGGQTTDEQIMDAQDMKQAFDRKAGAVVLALWRPDPALCQLADQLAFEGGQTWLPIVMEHPVIRIGPLVRAPAGPCFTCSYRRRAQHDVQHAATAILHASYHSDPTCGPGGYLPHHARLAAAIADLMLLAADTSEVTHPVPVAPGSVVTVRLTKPGLTASRVVPCGDCMHCGPTMPADPGTQPSAWLSNLCRAFSRTACAGP